MKRRKAVTTEELSKLEKAAPSRRGGSKPHTHPRMTKSLLCLAGLEGLNIGDSVVLYPIPETKELIIQKETEESFDGVSVVKANHSSKVSPLAIKNKSALDAVRARLGLSETDKVRDFYSTSVNGGNGWVVVWD